MSHVDYDRYFCEHLPTKPNPSIGTVLVTGASGYIGGRLVPELLYRGYKVRVMVRAAGSAYQDKWPTAEVIEVDAHDPESMNEALKDVSCAYFLIHSLLLGPEEFERADIRAAEVFRKIASEQGVKRIVYLGGLGDLQSSQSPHLRSRARVAEELRAGDVPVTILRAATIIGAGSASYEIIRHLASRLLVSPIPRWARNSCQPIGVEDVIKYLVGVLETAGTQGRSFDIGGRDILSYERMLKVFASTIAGRLICFPVPISNIGFYSYIASLMTPVPAPITRALMEGLKDEVICSHDDIKVFVPIEPMPYQEAIVRALTREEQDIVATRWSDAYPPAHELAIKLHELRGAPKYGASYSLVSPKQRAAIFNSVCKIGGETGWFNNNWMWKIRGGFDRIIFGVGSQRGRKRKSVLEINDVVDFWRVEDIEVNRCLLLRAEMKLPGKAWLEFSVDHAGDKNRLSIRAYFHTVSFWGKLYWYAFLPFHHFIFTDLIEQIERRS